MCGICGYVGDNVPRLLEPMCQAMAHRGPDDNGTWHDAKSRVGLGHRRLSIIDLSPAGHQPMSNEDGSIWIVFNGEIYDYPELRRSLVARGHVFRSQSDTEVLVHLYEERGKDLLSELNGIFAFAIWDSKKRELLLARDHAGVKPLYYWQDGERLFFASELKALLRIPGLPRDLNLEALEDYLTFLWVPGDITMLQAVKKVEPGHYVLWKEGRIETRQWFELPYEPDETPSEDDWAEQVRDTFMRTTRRQMVSDVPLGAFLSGGADSSSIVACMRDAFPDREIRCYTARLRPKDLDSEENQEDYPYATKVADRLNVKLKSFLLEPEVISLLPKMVYHLDEPDADPAVFPSYLISQAARDDGTTVLLSGTGGDEVFFGYRSHLAQRLHERLRWIPSWLMSGPLGAGAAVTSALLGARSALPRRLRKVRTVCTSQGLARYLALADWSRPEVRRRMYTPELAAQLRPPGHPPPCMQKYFDSFVGSGVLNRHSHMMIQGFLAAHNFLYTDKTSMAASIEVRVPFMDVELMRLCARIPERHKLRGRVTKSLFKKSMEPYLGRDILYRSKTGFGAPMRHWIAKDLSEAVQDLLREDRLKSRGLFRPEAIRRILHENQANMVDHTFLIYALLTLEIWQQTFIDRPAEQVVL